MITVRKTLELLRVPALLLTTTLYTPSRSLCTLDNAKLVLVAPLTVPLALYDMGIIIRAVPHSTRFRVSTAFFNNEEDVVDGEATDVTNK